MTIRMMRCVVSHFAGDKYIKEGTILPEGDPDIIREFWTLYEIQEPTSARSTRKSK